MYCCAISISPNSSANRLILSLSARWSYLSPTHACIFIHIHVAQHSISCIFRSDLGVKLLWVYRSGNWIQAYVVLALIRSDQAFIHADYAHYSMNEFICVMWNSRFHRQWVRQDTYGSFDTVLNNETSIVWAVYSFKLQLSLRFRFHKSPILELGPSILRLDAVYIMPQW